MRIALLFILGSLGACGGDPPNSTAGVTDAGTGTGTGTESSTMTAPTSGGGLCEAGSSSACTCANSAMGTQMCRPDGTGYFPCECGGGGSMSASEGTSGGPDTSTGTLTTTDSGTTDSGTTTGGTTTTESSTGGVACDDPGPEPNEVENAAIKSGEQNCNGQPKTAEGVLDGDGDVDWFSYHGVWSQLCVLGPNTSAKLAAAEDVRLCVYADCDAGNANFSCKDGVMKVMSPDGLAGCCNLGDVGFDLSCGLLNQNATIFIRVDEAPKDACVAYSVEYDYDT